MQQKAESAGAAAIKHDTAAAPKIHPTVPPPPPPPPPGPPPAARPEPPSRGPQRAAAWAQPRQTGDTALRHRRLAQRPGPSGKIIVRLAYPPKPETRNIVVGKGST